MNHEIQIDQMSQEKNDLNFGKYVNNAIFLWVYTFLKIIFLLHSRSTIINPYFISHLF